MQEAQKQPLDIFVSCAPEDEIYCKELENHLAAMRDEDLITDWYPYKIAPGADRNHEIITHLERADIVLILISANYIASDCYDDHGIARVMEQYE